MLKNHMNHMHGKLEACRPNYILGWQSLVVYNVTFDCHQQSIQPVPHTCKRDLKEQDDRLEGIF